MIRRSLFGLMLSGLVTISCSVFAIPCQAFEGGNGNIASNALRMENQARASNDANSWQTAASEWSTLASSMSTISSPQVWVKDRPNTANKEICVAIYKRAIACLLKAYDLEGEHDNPRSRARSEALRLLSQVYDSLCNTDPTNSSWFYLRGEALTSQGLYKQADPDLKKAVSLGGAGGTKASALLTHTKPFLAHQLANDHALWVHNEAVDKYNAAHYVPRQQTGPGMNYVDFYRRTHGQNFNGGQN